MTLLNISGETREWEVLIDSNDTDLLLASLVNHIGAIQRRLTVVFKVDLINAHSNELLELFKALNIFARQNSGELVIDLTTRDPRDWGLSHIDCSNPLFLEMFECLGSEKISLELPLSMQNLQQFLRVWQVIDPSLVSKLALAINEPFADQLAGALHPMTDRYLEIFPRLSRLVITGTEADINPVMDSIVLHPPPPPPPWFLRKITDGSVIICPPNHQRGVDNGSPHRNIRFDELRTRSFHSEISGALGGSGVGKWAIFCEKDE
jgi:hypothetical protein